MQNFPNSPVPLHPGFSRPGSVVGSPYQHHPSDLQISPRNSEDYAPRQQTQPNLQSHGQHLRSQQHLLHAPPIHGYGSRRAAGELTQGNTHSGGGNSYRKDSVDYYFSVSGRERSRRGGAAYGAGFRYSNMDGHAPHQYQHLSGSGSSSGMISPYSMDYSSGSASAVGSSNSSGAGCFSPSQQYSLAHTASVQSGAQMHQLQHGQRYQGLHQGQHQRTYPISGNRIPPQFGHYAPLNATTDSTGMYNSPPQRYGTSSSSTDAKMNNSPTQSNPNTHTSSSASNSCENMGQSYTSSAYSPQSQSLHKHAPHSQRPSQLSTGAGHDPSLKMQHQGHLHTKLPHSLVSSSPALPSHPSQDIAKSPLHSQSQQARIDQNFSPISNPSPGPSAVQSPSCSSSSSPLMGSSEGNNAVIHLQPSSNPSVSNARSSQSHGRLLQAVPQLSPTPNSNSSISSCGSGIGTKAAVLNHGAGVGHAAMSQNRMRQGLRGGPGEDGSLYPHDKLLQDPGLNSLNALTSQVENLPNTVQHMLLTDTVLPLKKGRDSAHHLQVQQGSQSFLGNQNKSGNSSASGQTLVNKESSEMLEAKGDQQVECERNRQASETSNESEPQSYPSSQSQMPSEARQQVLDLQVNTGVLSTGSKQLSQANTPETLTPSSSSPPSSVHASAEPSPKQPVYPPAPPSPINSAHPNCVAEKYLHNYDDDSVTKGCKIKMIKDEESEVENADPSCDRENSENKRSVPPTKDEAKSDAKEFESQSKNENVSEQHNFGGVGVIVSARSEGNTESSKHTGARSPRYGVSHYSNKHSKPGDQLDVNVLRETRNHNGEGEMCMEKYVSQYDISPKQEFGQNPQPSIQSHSASFKYSNPDVHYKAAKSRGKLGLGSSMGTNRCQNYHQLEASYGSIGRKEIGVFGMEGGRAIVSRSQDSSSQFHQSFPSLLQEVLQGHHLDRRYGRPDQTSSVHQQSQDTSQYRYQTRLPYSMDENLSSHAMGSQTLISGLNVKFRQMASGKPPNSSQNQGPDNDIVLGPSHPSWDSEAHKPNVTHGISLEQDKTSLSPSQSSHMEQCLDLTTGVPSKHINLADYSLQHRKPPRYGTSSSAVEQLLLQEAEPLACGVGPICHTQSQTSSGRRSVICDVSPSRRTTPERERGHSGTSGPSVIQQPFSSSGSNEQKGKEEIKVKKAQKKEDSSKSETAGQNTDGNCSMPPSKECSKPLHPLVDVDFDIEKTNSAKGNSEATSNLPYLLQMSSNPLSSPPRHQSFSQAVDGFRAYGFSDTVDGPKIISHPRPHQPFHTVSAYSKTTPSTNKLQAFPQSLPPHERHDWTPDRQRLRGIDRHIPQRLSEQKGKSQASSDILPSQHHQSRQHPYPSSHFDMKRWDTYPEREGAGQPTTVPHEHVGSRPVTNAVPKPGEDGISDKSADDTAKSFHSLASVDAVSPAEQPGKTSQGIHQGQRATKTGTLTETNPLIMRRRVRSFISPIPAKRQHQDVPGQRPGSAYHSPLSQSHSDSKLATNNGSGSTDTQTKLSSPKTQYSISSANSPSQPKAKFLPPRKGHGLKLEAIVRKITPSVKKNDFNNSHVESNFSEVSHYASDIPDHEGGTSFSSVSQGDEACLSYLDDSHTLDDLMPYRVVEDAFSCDSQTLKLGATASSTNALRSLPKDFDFGLGAAGSSGSLGESDKDDFTLLGPLPPAPPLPCPVQGSPPSSSALSDIQQFTNTYQQLETRRGEQSAANLLKQKLEETGMGFDDYPGGDYYGTTTGHSQSPGHHLLSRASQHQMTSLRSTSSDTKTSENTVPKGYFPSGKKKGRPVGSVNKQKRAQAQIQNTAASIPVDSVPSPTAEPQSVPIPDTASEVPQVSTPPDQKPCPSLSPPAQTQVVKVDVESEETQPELDVKPVRHRPKKGKEDNETPGDQGRRRRGMASKEKLDTQASSRGNISPCGILSDARSNLFTPYIHVEKKIAEIGAVCTIINADDEKFKCGDKAGHLAVDGPLNFPLSSQLVRKEKENERTKENWVSEPVDSALQSGKTLPTSEYVLPGPVISETGHTGRLLCCLCQKWANYKHLGDLYGPFYPAEYAAKLPKNQPQVRQTSSNHGASTTGFSMTSVPIETTPQDTRLQDSQNIKSCADSDHTVSQATNSASPATTVGTVSPSMGEEMPFQNVKMSSSPSKVTAHTWGLAGGLTSELGTSKAQELDGEIVLKQLHVENTQQRPQHRKLTSHPRFKRRHKSNEDLPRTVPINSKASLPFQPPPPSLDSLDPMAQMAQLPLVPLDPEELWVHEGCIVWTSGVYLVNGRLYGLQEALDGARDTSCSHCEMVGSTLGCYSKGCTLSYHYLCAIEADCSLNEDNFSLRCPKHKAWSGVSGAVGARTSAPSDRRDSLAVLERCDQTLCCASLQQRLCPAGRQPWTQSSDTFSKEH